MCDFTGTFVEALVHKLRFIVAIINDIQNGCSDNNLEISSKTLSYMELKLGLAHSGTMLKYTHANKKKATPSIRLC